MERQMEVALLEWNDMEQGVRLVGRSSDPSLVRSVRKHLSDEVHPDPGGPTPDLQLVKPPTETNRGGGEDQ
jgi:hypothetical protein